MCVIDRTHQLCRMKLIDIMNYRSQGHRLLFFFEFGQIEFVQLIHMMFIRLQKVGETNLLQNKTLYILTMQCFRKDMHLVSKYLK